MPGNQPLAHSRSKSGRVDTVTDHLQSVATRAAEFAAEFGAGNEARLAGLLHDLGKYGELFQSRLRGEVSGIDHWSAGAWRVLDTYRHNGIAAALAVQGHHVGLQEAAKDALKALRPDILRVQHPLGLRLSEPQSGADAEIGLPSPESVTASVFDSQSGFATAAMLDLRMLFSALVDADFIETEAHFAAEGDSKRYRAAGAPLEPARALDVVLAHIRKLSTSGAVSERVQSLRTDLLKACLDAAISAPGLFTLTAPTGSGKTLAMLAFALKHAAAHNLRRVVLVIPYLSIIEQTVHVYRQVLEPVMGPGYVLEDHSLAGTRGQDSDTEDVEATQRLQAENWDAPIVVTTSVQMLESLFANRPSACRKLHRLARSVILFDEVQTLCAKLAIPTLAALSRLTERYGTTVVFATATQPAFHHLDRHVKEHCACGWRPTEIVPSQLGLFDRARRTTVRWPDLKTTVTWDEIADELASQDAAQSLCVVNLKRHALDLFRRLRSRGIAEDELFHLSTNMCPAHRKVVLAEVNERLRAGRPCRLVSTQCVEAGVDVDFPVVYRAWGPLESIAQVAGRCNRNGRLEAGTVRVFVPEDDAYPSDAYQQAATVARIVAGLRALDIDDPQMFRQYYERLYDILRPENRSPKLIDAILRKDFVDVAQLYRVIPQDAVNVLVPYDPGQFRALMEEVRSDGLTRSWIARARPYAVSIYRPQRDSEVRGLITPLPAGRGEWAEDWFEYVGSPADYDAKTGLVLPQGGERLLIA